MKLGFIRMPDHHQRDVSHAAIAQRLKLADRLGIYIAYLPKVSPTQVLALEDVQNKTLKIAIDATSFGRRAPRDLEASVRYLNNALQERLYLGIDICCDSACAQQRAQAQEFETIFSQDTGIGASGQKAVFPMQSPCPKVLGLPVQGTPQEAAFAAARGYLPLTPSYLSVAEAARHWPSIVAGATSTLRRANPNHWQLARSIVIHNDRATLESYVFGAKSPIRAYYARLKNLGQLHGCIDAHLRSSVIAGSAQQVAEKILALKETVGDIGTLYFMDHPESNTAIMRNTLVRLAQDVMPQVRTTDRPTFKELEKI